MDSLSKILSNNTEQKVSLIDSIMTNFTHFFNFLPKEDNFVVGLVEINNRSLKK